MTSFVFLLLRRLGCLLVLFLFAGCFSRAEDIELDLAKASWQEIEEAARGRTVDVAMWQGDPFINAYMQEYVAGNLKERYGIELNFISAQGGQIVSAVMTELEAGAAESGYDVVWINGETFYQLQQIEALYGPFTDRLPNARYIDFENPFIGVDFQRPIEGYEAPWGNVQMAIIYDSLRVVEPPRTRDELASWVREHPGRFTFDNHFTGMTFLKALLIDVAGGPEKLSGPFDVEAYARYSSRLWEYLREIKPYLWNEGRSYPSNVAQLHQLFASGEVDFTISNNDGEVDNKVLQGVFPVTARAYVPDFGSIRNSHYWGILRHARDKAAALVAVNFMISPEAQLRKLDPEVWGDGTVLDVEHLPDPWPERFSHVPNRRFAPPRAAIQERALPELAPEYMMRLYEDFRREIIQG